jgi:hypothetical protein
VTQTSGKYSYKSRKRRARVTGRRHDSVVVEKWACLEDSNPDKIPEAAPPPSQVHAEIITEENRRIMKTLG